MRLNTLLILFSIILGSLVSQAKSLSPPVPDGYFSVKSGPCHIAVPERNSGLADDLLAVCIETHNSIYKQLGIDLDKKEDPVSVRVVGEPNDMRSVAPPDNEPPPWSGAVAYPDYNLVILSLRDHMGNPVTDLDVVLEHELSHLALREALAGIEVPRWFSEGIAIQQSEESSFRRYWLVWLAARGDNLLPLSGIERYPTHLGRINLAYAEAADFVGFLLRKDGWSGLRILIRECEKGAGFKEAFEFSYRDSIENLEKEWRAGLTSRWQWLPFITGTGALWGVTVALFLLAYTVVRRRGKKRLREMEEEEKALYSLVKTEVKAADAKPKPHVVLRTPTKIRVDDDIHTLH
jgi:hypothetical protein